MVIHSYTPIENDRVLGEFKLLIKVYSPTEEFPEGGRMSQYISNMKPFEDKMKFKSINGG